MANRDLRHWIEGVRAAGELKVITGAEPKGEIDMRKMGNPAVLFDQVPGFPKGHRVIANILTSFRASTWLLPPETSETEQIQWWRN
jgi:3-polyprenyl-4-hydroxybenzoate decarboxylase